MQHNLLDPHLYDKQEEELARAEILHHPHPRPPAETSSLFILLSSWRNVYMHADNSRDSWSMYHHYSAMTMALVSLTWEITGEPDSAKKQTAVQLFLQWAMMQGGAMLMQNRYQRQRRLTCVALRRLYFVGCFLVFMAVGNFVSLIKALLTESRSKVEMKRLKSKVEMD